MAQDLKGIAERIVREYDQQAEEMERTVPTCDTCLLSKGCAQEYPAGEHYKVGNKCTDFVPETWKDHIHFNGEWWS